jgi:hypothetical protein
MEIMSTNYTDLEIFNIVANSLVNQEQRSVDEYGNCNFYSLRPGLFEEMTETLSEALSSISVGSYTDIDHEVRCIVNKLSLGIYNSQPENTLRCAVGWLIDPSLYSRELENKSYSSDEIIDLIHESYPTWTVNTVQIQMLGMLQRIHDNYQVDDWGRIFDLARIHCFDQDGFFKRTKYGENSSVTSFFDTLYDLDIYSVH